MMIGGGPLVPIITKHTVCQDIVKLMVIIHCVNVNSLLFMSLKAHIKFYHNHHQCSIVSLPLPAFLASHMSGAFQNQFLTTEIKEGIKIQTVIHTLHLLMRLFSAFCLQMA